MNTPLTREQTSQRLGEFILSKGYVPATVGCMAMSPDSFSKANLSFGILSANDTVSWNHDGHRIRRKLVAFIWYGNMARLADSKNWLIEVYGKHNVAPMQEFAVELGNLFKVSVSVVLESTGFLPEEFPEN